VISATRWVYFAYAALLIVGGIAGYVEKKSVISLVAGVACGGLTLAAALLLASRPRPALVMGIVAALLVGGSMGARFAKNPKLFPGGVTLAASVVSLLVSVAAFVTTQAGGTVIAAGTRGE